MKTLAIIALCLFAVAFAEESAEKKETVKVPVVPYPSFYYPYTHYYQGSPYAHKPVSSYSYSYGTYYHPQTPYKYVVPSYVPVQYYP